MCNEQEMQAKRPGTDEAKKAKKEPAQRVTTDVPRTDDLDQLLAESETETQQNADMPADTDFRPLARDTGKRRATRTVDTAKPAAAPSAAETSKPDTTTQAAPSPKPAQDTATPPAQATARADASSDASRSKKKPAVPTLKLGKVKATDKSKFIARDAAQILFGQAANATPALSADPAQMSRAASDIVQNLPASVVAALSGTLDEVAQKTKDEGAFFAKWDSVEAILSDKTLKDPVPGSTQTLKPDEDRAAVLRSMKDHLSNVKQRHDAVMKELAKADMGDAWDDLLAADPNSKSHYEKADEQLAGRLSSAKPDQDNRSRQEALLQGRLLAEAMKAHVPDALQAEFLRGSADSPDFLLRMDDLIDGLTLNDTARKTAFDVLKKDAEKNAQAERAPFETVIKKHSGTSLDNFDPFLDQLFHPPSADEFRAMVVASEKAGARAQRALDLGMGYREAADLMEHIPHAFWPPAVVEEIQAYRRVERDLREERIAALFAQGMTPSGKALTKLNFDSFAEFEQSMSGFLGDVMTLVNPEQNEGAGAWAPVADDTNLHVAEGFNWGGAFLSNLYDTVQEAREIHKDRADDPDRNARITMAVLNAVKSSGEAGLGIGDVTGSLTDAFEDVVGIGIVTELLGASVDFIKILQAKDIKDDMRRQIAQMANLKAMGDKAADTGMMQALYNEKDARTLQQKKLAFDMAVHGINAVGSGADYASAGTPIKAIGKVIEFGGRVVIANIDFNRMKDARKTIDEARAGSAVAQVEVMRDSALYAKSYIAALALEDPPDPRALDFIVRRGITEWDLQDEAFSNKIIREILMDHADQKDETAQTTSRGKALFDGATDGFFDKGIPAWALDRLGLSAAAKERKLEKTHRQIQQDDSVPLDGNITDCSYDAVMTLAESMRAAGVYPDKSMRDMAVLADKAGQDLSEIGGGQTAADYVQKGAALSGAKANAYKEGLLKSRHSLVQLKQAAVSFTPLTTPKGFNPDDDTPLTPVVHENATNALCDFSKNIAAQIQHIEKAMEDLKITDPNWQPENGEDLAEITRLRRATEFNAGATKESKDRLENDRKELESYYTKDSQTGVGPAEAKLPLSAQSFGKTFEAYLSKQPEYILPNVLPQGPEGFSDVEVMMSRIERVRDNRIAVAKRAVKAQKKPSSGDAKTITKASETEQQKLRQVLDRAQSDINALLAGLSALRPTVTIPAMRDYIDHLMEVARRDQSNLQSQKDALENSAQITTNNKDKVDAGSFKEAIASAVASGAVNSKSRKLAGMVKAMRAVRVTDYRYSYIDTEVAKPNQENYGGDGRKVDERKMKSRSELHQKIGEYITSEKLPKPLSEYLTSQLKALETEISHIDDRIKRITFKVSGPSGGAGSPSKKDVKQTLYNAISAGAVRSDKSASKLPEAVDAFRTEQKKFEGLRPNSDRDEIAKREKKLSEAATRMERQIRKLGTSANWNANDKMKKYLDDLLTELVDLRSHPSQKALKAAQEASDRIDRAMKQDTTGAGADDMAMSAIDGIKSAATEQQSLALGLIGLPRDKTALTPAHKTLVLDTEQHFKKTANTARTNFQQVVSQLNLEKDTVLYIALNDAVSTIEAAYKADEFQNYLREAKITSGTTSKTKK